MIKQKISICIVDNHADFSEMIKKLLLLSNKVTDVCHIDRGDKFIDLLKSNKISPDLVLLDIELSDISGFFVTKQAREILPEIKIVCHSIHDDMVYEKMVIDAGALKLISKNDFSIEILKLLDALIKGDTILPSYQVKNDNNSLANYYY